MRVQQLLQPIGDVVGVVGSLVSSERGDLIDALMPAEIGRAELERTASRLASIVRCAELCELPVEQCDLCHGQHQLMVKRFAGGLLAVAVERGASSQRALQMAMTVALEALPAVLGALGAPSRSAAAEEEPTSRYSFAEGDLHAGADRHLAGETGRSPPSPRVIPR